MKLIEKGAKKNGKKYVMQIQRGKKTVKQDLVRDRNNALLQTKNNKG